MAFPPQSASAELYGSRPMKNSTPKSLGYRMPAEFERQEAVWLTWPHNEITWPEGMIGEVERTYVEIIQALHTGQKIKLLVRNSESESNARLALERRDVALSQIIFF